MQGNETYNRKRYLFDEYFDYHKYYTEQYGPRTVVLFEVGSFYCIYGVDNETTKMNENIVKITELLHITLTRVDKSIVENNRQNPLMCGIPNHEHILNKYMKILVQDNNYTVIKINQKADRAGKMCRVVSKIYSPSTYIEEDEQVESNFLMGIYFDTKDYGSFCTVDLSSGNIMIYEPNNTGSFLDEIYRFRKSYKPKEYLICYNPGLVLKEHIEEIIGYLDLESMVYHLRDLPRKDAVWHLNFQNEFLLKVYPKHQFLTPIEYIDLEKNPVSVITLIKTIEFAYEHDDRIIHRLNKPVLIDQNNYLILETKAIEQLNLVSDKTDGKLSSVLNLIDHTKTVPGRRKLKTQIISPIIDPVVLQNRYDLVETILKNNELKEFLTKELSQIVDLERRHRKMTVGLLNPAEFYRLNSSYAAVLKIIDAVRKCEKTVSVLCPVDTVVDEFKNFIKEYNSKFDITEIQKYHLDTMKGSFFHEGVDKIVDTCHQKIKKILKAMNSRCKELSELIGDAKNPDSVTLEYNTINGYYFKITKTRYNTLVNKLKDAKREEELSKYEVKKNKNDYKMVSPKLREISGQLIILETKLERRIKKVYTDLIIGWGTKFAAILQTITEFVSTVDVLQSHACTATNYGYTKPILVAGEHSFINAKALRNCLAEKINTKVKFVPNDIQLGNDVTGMLLFSVNGCGKSTLLKSVATAVILAQIGCYVPANEFRYTPFKNILTRMGNQDNIFKNQSTFQIEMLELRTILNRATTRSLVITDELCAGTENSSATKIMASTIIMLAQKQVNFIFATHLHNLNQISSVTSLKNVKTYHLKVEPHPETGKPIYNRKLADGPGDSVYGLEIAKYILNNNEFMKIAMNVHKEVDGIPTEILDDKKSRYNQRVFVNKCEICGETEFLETHHIQFQCTAVNKKIDAGSMSIHHQSNLVVLCNNCHLNVHKGNIRIGGWKESIESGKFLDYTSI